MATHVLFITFTNLNDNARALKLVETVAADSTVTTVSYGGATPWSSSHIEIPQDLSPLPTNARGLAAVVAEKPRKATLAVPATKFVLEALADYTFDLVIAGDIASLPCGFVAASGGPVWADVSTSIEGAVPRGLTGRLLMTGFLRSLGLIYLTRTAAITVPDHLVAEDYQREFGLATTIIHDASDAADISPLDATPTETIRLVYEGTAAAKSGAEDVIDAVRMSGGPFSLDIFLASTGDDGRYLRFLRSIADGIPEVSFYLQPPRKERPYVYHRYDVGVAWQPPSSRHGRPGLNSSFFDYMQARLAILASPYRETRDFVDRFGLGPAVTDHSLDSLAQAMGELTLATVAEYRRQTTIAADLVNSSTEAQTIRAILSRLLP